MSEENKATAGPWHIAPIATWMIEDDYGNKIVECIGDGVTIEQDRANAALIVRAVNGLGEMEAMRKAAADFLNMFYDNSGDTPTFVIPMGFDETQFHLAFERLDAALSRGEG